MDLERLMADLTPQQREVLALRFGLAGRYSPKIGALTSVVNGWQIEREALTKLRKRKLIWMSTAS